MRKRTWIGISVAVVAILAGAAAWYLGTHIRVNGQFYPAGAAQLDLRGRELTAAEYDELTARLPDCRIVWDVPFQGNRLAQDSRRVAVSTLTDEDVALLAYFPALEQLDGTACTDYPQLLAAKERYPGLAVDYCVTLAGKILPWDTETAELTDASGEELTANLPLLPHLGELKLTGDLPEASLLVSLRSEKPDRAIRWEVTLGGKIWADDVSDLSGLKKADAADLSAKLQWLPEVQRADLRQTGLTDSECRALADEYPGIHFIFDTVIAEQSLCTDAEELDFTGIPFDDTAQLEAALPYFRSLKKVIMSGCGLPSTVMDELNSRYADVRFVWTVRIGPINVRTDDTWFAPVKFGAHVTGKQMEELRYCTDMVCIDIGHMETSTCEWAAYMPNLTYLVIGDTMIDDLSPLSGLKNLKFLEVFKTPVTDYSPLLGCTGLEDLNIGFTRGDPEPVFKMQWLKNLWWCSMYGIFDGEGNPLWMVIKDKMPNARVYYLDLESSTAGGWRRLDNYYAMRDYLGMFYMDG